MLLLRKMRNDRRGFLLLEVVLSVSAIAVGLVFVIRSYSSSLRVTDIAQKLSQATLHLEEKLFEQVDVMEQGIEEGDTSEKIDDDYKWFISAHPMDQDKNKKLHRVKLGVEYRVGSQIRDVSIATLHPAKEG